MAENTPDPDPKKPGPEPERLKIDGDWEDAVSKALNKKKPADGWPKVPEEDQDEPAAEDE